MYDSVILGHELAKRAHAWRDPESGELSPFGEDINEVASELIAGEAVILKKPSGFLSRLRFVLFGD